MKTEGRLLRAIAAILLSLLSVVPLCIPHAPVSALDLLSVSFERTNETPVSVDFRVTVINNGPDDINNIPLNILFSGIDQSQIREVTVNSVSKVTAVREEPIIESVEKRYKPEGRVELSTDSEGNTYFTDIVLSKGGNKITLGIGEIVEGDIVQSGQYEKYDESTGEYIWHEDEVVGTKEIPYLVESKALLHDFKVTPNSKLTISFSQPSISHNDYGTGNGVRVFDVTINTGEQTNGKGWGSKGLMIWDVDGIKFYDNQHSSWWDNSWKYRQQLKFNNATISENLIDFPVGIFLDNTNFHFSQAQAAGQDIRFVDADGTTPLKYEIVSWDGSSAEIYVKVPQIDSFSNSDYIFMYWGNSTCADGSDRANVWDSHYISVYHMNDKTGDATKILDSTSHAYDGTKGMASRPTNATNIYNGTGTLATNPTTVAAGTSETTVAVTGAGTFTITIPANQMIILSIPSTGGVSSVSINNPFVGSRTITVVGTGNFIARWSTTAAPAEVTGLTGKAQQFSQVNSTYAVTPNYSFGDSGTLTFQFMAKYTSNTGTKMLCGDATQVGNSGFIFFTIASSSLRFDYANGTSVVNLTLSSVSEYLNTYALYTVVADYTAGTVDLYINGLHITQKTMITPLYPSTSRVKYIGNYSTIHPYGFDGNIDRIDISNTGRSAGWIAATNKSLRDTYVSFGTKQGKPLPPANLISTRNGNNIDLTWDMGTLATGVIIVRGTSDYPASPTDGVVVYTGAGTSYTDTGAASDTEDVYYSAFSTSEWGTSATFTSSVLGGGMSKIVLLMTLMGAAIILTISGYISRKSILAVMGGLFWVITGVYAYTLSAQNWSAWDIYLGLAFGCLFFTIVSVIAPIVVRERNEEDNELPYKESDVMQFNREMSEMNMQLHAMNSYPPQTQTPTEEPNTADIQRYIEQTRNRTIKKYKGMQ